jgi:hypothetical protein
MLATPGAKKQQALLRQQGEAERKTNLRGNQQKAFPENFTSIISCGH